MRTGPRWYWLSSAGLCASLVTGCGGAPRPVAEAASAAPASLAPASAAPAVAVSSSAGASPGPATTVAPLPSPVATSPSAAPSAVAPSTPVPAASTSPTIVHTFAWWDHPQGFNTRVETAYTLPTSLTSARHCRMTDLDVSANAGAAAGTVFAGVYFHNISATACEMSGSPGLALIDNAGTIWQSAPAERAATAHSVVLIPNSWAATQPWAVENSCGSEPVTTTLRVTLPDDAAFRVVPLVVGSAGPPHCGGKLVRRPHPGELAVPPIEPMDAPTGTGHFVLMDSLTSSLRVPPTVRRGATLTYQLLLIAEEPNGSAVDNLCPLYQQRLTGVAGGGSYELRCDLTVNLSAGQAVAYDLQLAVPADAPLGPTTLRFQFLEPALPPLYAPITVVP